MRDDKRDRPLCAGCGDVIGEYEPAWVENQDGTWHPSSLLNLGDDARKSALRLWHAGCAVTNAPPAP